MSATDNVHANFDACVDSNDGVGVLYSESKHKRDTCGNARERKRYRTKETAVKRRERRLRAEMRTHNRLNKLAQSTSSHHSSESLLAQVLREFVAQRHSHVPHSHTPSKETLSQSQVVQVPVAVEQPAPVATHANTSAAGH